MPPRSNSLDSLDLHQCSNSLDSFGMLWSSLRERAPCAAETAEEESGDWASEELMIGHGVL